LFSGFSRSAKCGEVELKASADNPEPATSHDRRFYATTRAFGRFGMRIFAPKVMEHAHWHGHVEANFLSGAAMLYNFDGEVIEVPPDRLVIFWAGIPHRLTDIIPTSNLLPQLANIYLPLDAFLFMPHLAETQVALMRGGMAILDSEDCDLRRVERWYKDYRSNDFERIEVLKLEMNALLRRAQAVGMTYLREPAMAESDRRAISSAHIRHVVAMLRFILENLDRPLSNADVAAVTGLHQNYALSLFSGTMRMPVKRFTLRMRLLRARALLLESSTAISTVAEISGFTSISQFYDHFKRAYGQPPQALRARYTRMALR
jgi:AraC-like DNA-binding protein